MIENILDRFTRSGIMIYKRYTTEVIYMAKWLTDSSVKRASAGTHFDSSRCGLFLWVRGGSKRWYQSVSIHNKRVKIGLGSPLLMTAEQARQKAFDNLTIAKSGGDPRKPKSAMQKLHDRTFAPESTIPTFREEAERVIKLKSSGWKDSKGIGRKWRSTLEKYAYPTIGDMPVNEITRQDVKAILEPHWTEINPTMRKLRQRISEVFKVSMVDGYTAVNPAGDEILTVLPALNGESKHHKALKGSDQVKEAIRTIRSSTSYAGSRLCLEFLILTGVRSIEARSAKWDEIDTEKAVWTIPAERMKAGKEHRVPLSKQAVSVLQKAKQIGFARKAGLIFPSQSGRLQDGAMLSRLLKKENIDSTVHGFRTSFSSYLNENNYNADAIEACLAHTTQGVRGAYMRGDFFEQRREIMEKWGEHIA